MKKIYIVNVLGAPSPTAVVLVEENNDIANWRKLAYNAYYFLQAKEINFSKMAIIKLKDKNNYDFKFIQIKKTDDIVEFESNANCGNSMVACARAVYKQDNISLTNIDTGLKISVEKNENSFDLNVTSLVGKNVNSAKIKENFENSKFSLINIVAPYIIVNAEDFGIKTNEELLTLNENNRDILERAKKLRKDIAKKYDFDENSEFPKIALVLNNSNNLCARTIYLNNWHPGLPLTGAISIQLASKIKGSVIYNENFQGNEILTPKGPKIINIDIDDNGQILTCKILNIKPYGNIDTYDFNE